MPKSESLNDFIPRHITIPRMRVAAIRDIISESRQDSLPREEIINKVHSYCIEKNLEVNGVYFEMDEDIESIAVRAGDTVYYFKA